MLKLRNISVAGVRISALFRPNPHSVGNSINAVPNCDFAWSWVLSELYGPLAQPRDFTLLIPKLLYHYRRKGAKHRAYYISIRTKSRKSICRKNLAISDRPKEQARGANSKRGFSVFYGRRPISSTWTGV